MRHRSTNAGIFGGSGTRFKKETPRLASGEAGSKHRRRFPARREGGRAESARQTNEGSDFRSPLYACNKVSAEKSETLGNFLHAAKKYHAPDSPHWKKLRSDLETAVSELEHANSGRLLGPLLVHPNKRYVDMKLELPTPEEQEAVKCLAAGVETIMEVRYE